MNIKVIIRLAVYFMNIAVLRQADFYEYYSNQTGGFVL
jgi:hypothetical protein